MPRSEPRQMRLPSIITVSPSGKMENGFFSAGSASKRDLGAKPIRSMPSRLTASSIFFFNASIAYSIVPSYM